MKIQERKKELVRNIAILFNPDSLFQEGKSLSLLSGAEEKHLMNLPRSLLEKILELLQQKQNQSVKLISRVSID